MSPHAAYLWGMKQGGEREHRRIAYDNRFLKATCPTTTKETALVQKGSGIKVNHCRSPYLVLEGHTEKELLLATAELRQQAKRDGVRASLSALAWQPS